MRKINVPSPFTIEEADNLFARRNLLYEDIKKYGIKIFKEDCAIYSEGKLVLILIKNCLSQSLIENTLAHLQKVGSDPGNRPEIFGNGARQQRVRNDNTLSPRIATPKEVVAFTGGKADFLGFYRYKNKAPGVPDCGLTNWTKNHLDIYEGVAPFIVAVDEIYRLFAPEQHARQSEYLSTIPDWRMGQTAFTTLYVIKNISTACHRDKLDIPEGFGVMATLGRFSGAEFCMPRFRVAVDYRPGDVLLANVHELHGNFPLKEGSQRITSVFFCRKGMHECS
jgi:hypothetical protein